MSMKTNAIRGAAAAVSLLSMAVAMSAGAAFAGPADDPANWRKVDLENVLDISINRQDVLIELRPDFAPNHVAQIKKIAKAGHYDRLPFHRVIDDFMAQGGEVSAIYMLSTPYPTLKAEFTFRRDPRKTPVQWFGKAANGDNVGYLDGFIVHGQPDEAADLMADHKVDTWAIHCPGIASMARTNDPDSADTQYFLMRQSREALDKTYTIWGRALVGLDIIRGIKAGSEDKDGRLAPGEGDKTGKVQLVSDIKSFSKPTAIYVQRTDGPMFAAALAAAKASPADDACNLPPVQIIVERPPSE
jgi:peptidylprolyl isomerase